MRKGLPIAAWTTVWAVLLVVGFAGAQYQPVNLWGFDGSYLYPISNPATLALPEETAPSAERANSALIWAEDDGAGGTDLWFMLDDPAGGTAIQLGNADDQRVGGSATSYQGDDLSIATVVASTSINPSAHKGADIGTSSALTFNNIWGESVWGNQVDATSATGLSVGAVNATSVLIGDAGVTTEVEGVLYVEGEGKFIERPGDPGAEANRVFLYAKDDGGGTSALYAQLDDGSVVELTAAGASLWTDLGTEIEPASAGDDIVPNGTATVGTALDPWDEVYSAGATFSGALATTSSTYSIGSNTTPWSFVYGNKMGQGTDSGEWNLQNVATNRMAVRFGTTQFVEFDAAVGAFNPIPDNIDLGTSVGVEQWHDIYFDGQLVGSGPDCWEATFNNEGSPYTNATSTPSVPSGLTVTPGAGEYNVICTAELNTTGGSADTGVGYVYVNAVQDATSKVRRSLSGGGGEFGSWSTQARVTAADSQAIDCRFALVSAATTLQIAHAKLSVCETYAAN